MSLDLIHSVWISMLFEFLCRLVSHPFCLGLYVVRVSISLALFTVLHGSLFCPIFYVTWCHLRSVLVFMLSEFLCHLVSLPFCMGLSVVWVSVTWSHFHSVWVFMLSEFLSHLVLPPLRIGPCVVWARCFFDRTFQENLLPSDVHVPHHNQRRQFVKLLLEKKYAYKSEKNVCLIWY